MQLYNGDCLEVMKSIPNKSIDLILCDLPYGKLNVNGILLLIYLLCGINIIE